MSIYEYIKARLATKEEGQSLAEYALILALVSIAAILVMTALGTAISAQFQAVIDAF